MRDAKYYLTIEKQERQPHELPLAELDAHANGLENKTQDSKEIFHYGLRMDPFAKKDETWSPRGFEPCAQTLRTLRLTPVPSRHLRNIIQNTVLYYVMFYG